MEQLEVLALARLDELLALNTLKQSIDSASTPPVNTTSTPIQSNSNDSSSSANVVVKPASTHAPLLSRSSTTDQEHDSPKQSAMIAPQSQANLPASSQPRIDGNPLEAMKKKLMREILTSKKAEHIRVSQEKEIIETFYHIQNLTVNDRKSFERVSHRLMQRINPAFNIPPASSENPISQIVQLYREFFCSIRQNKQAQEIDRIFTNSLCNKFSFVCLLINWLIEVTRSMLKDFIQSSKPDDSRKSPVKRFITSSTSNASAHHEQPYQQDTNSQQDNNLCEGSLISNNKNSENVSYQTRVLRYLRLLDNEKKRGSAVVAAGIIGNDSCQMTNSRSGYSLESKVRQSKGDKPNTRASGQYPTMNRLCQYYPASHSAQQSGSSRLSTQISQQHQQESFLHLQNQLIFMFLHQGVLLAPPAPQPPTPAQSSSNSLSQQFGQSSQPTNSQQSSSSHVSRLLNSADKLTTQVLQTQSINFTLVSKDFIWNTHVQLSSEYRLYGETLSDIDHTYITQNAPWIGSSSNSNSNKQQLSRKLAALHASKEWMESNYIAVLRAQLSKNTYIKSTINAFKSSQIPPTAIEVLASSTKQFSNASIFQSSSSALLFKKKSQKQQLEYYLSNASTTSQNLSSTSSPLKTVLEQSSQQSTACSELRSKFVQIQCTNATGRAGPRKKHKASNLSNSVVIPSAIDSSSKTAAAAAAATNSNQKARMVHSELILSRIALERKQQYQQQSFSNIQQDQSHLHAPPAQAPMSPSKSRVKSCVSQSDHKVRSSCARQRGSTTTSALSGEYEEQLSYMLLTKSQQPHEILPNVLSPNGNRSNSRNQLLNNSEEVESAQEANYDNNSNTSIINISNQVSIDHLLSQFNMIPSTDRMDSIQQESAPGYVVNEQQQQQLHSSRITSLRSTRLVSKQFLKDILNSAAPNGQTTTSDASNQQRQFALSNGFKLGIHDSKPEKTSANLNHHQINQSILVPTTTIEHGSSQQNSQRDTSKQQLRTDPSKQGIRSVSAFTTATQPQQFSPPPVDQSEPPSAPQPSTTIPLQQQIQLITQWKGRFKKQTDHESASDYISGVKGLSVSGQKQSQQSFLQQQQQQQQHSFQQRSIKSQNSFSQQQENTNPHFHGTHNRSSGAFPPNEQCERSTSIGTAEVISRVSSFSLRRHGSIDSTCHPLGTQAVAATGTAETMNSKQLAAPQDRFSILRRMQKHSQYVPATAYIGEELSDLTYFGVNQSTQRFSSQQPAQFNRKVSKKRTHTGGGGMPDSMMIVNQTTSLHSKQKAKSEKKDEQIVSLSPFQFRMINSQQSQQIQFNDIAINAKSRLQEVQSQQQQHQQNLNLVSNMKKNSQNRKRDSEQQQLPQHSYREDQSMQLPSISRRGIQEITLKSG